VILVLSADGLLKLPETGHQIHVKSGDMVPFLAKEQIHKLKVLPTEAGAVQTILTCWTNEAQSIEMLQKAHAGSEIAQPDQGDQGLEGGVSSEEEKESVDSTDL
jgi:hypothetical protein